MKKLQEQLEKKQKELERCRELRLMLYTDMKEGIVSKDDYRELHAAYGKRMKNADESIHLLKKEMQEVLDANDASNLWLDYFTKYQDIEELTRTVVVELIREIRVYDKKNIEITFDFDDCYQTVLEQLQDLGAELVQDENGTIRIHMKEAV